MSTIESGSMSALRYPSRRSGDCRPVHRVLLALPSIVLLAAFAVPGRSLADEATERCLQSGERFTSEAAIDAEELDEAIVQCSEAVAQHPDSDILNLAAARLMVRGGRALSALPYVETLIGEEASEGVATLVSEACVSLAAEELSTLSVEDLFASDGRRSLPPGVSSYCEIANTVVAPDPDLVADALYWAGLSEFARARPDVAVSLLADAAMYGHPGSMEITAYLCDVVDEEAPEAVIAELPVMGAGRVDLMGVAAAACEAAMNNPPEGREQGEFVERFAALLLGYDMSAEAAELLSSTALGLGEPYASRASELLLSLCDAVALHPSDPLATDGGVADDEVIPAHAVDFCYEALLLRPDDPRLKFQYARGLMAVEELELAGELLDEAMEAGYPLAASYLGHEAFDPSLFAAPEIMLALHEGDDEGLAEIEKGYRTIAQDALGVQAGPTPYMHKFLSSLITTFVTFETYDTCAGRTYVRGTEISDMQHRLQQAQLGKMIDMFNNPDPYASWRVISDVMEQSGLLDGVAEAGHAGPMMGSLIEMDMNVTRLYEQATNTGASSARVLAIDLGCGPSARRIMENITDYAAGQPMRHKG